MAELYTEQEIQDALRDLRIDPVEGNVTTTEAARILTWRATRAGIPHEYPESAVRRRVQSGRLRPVETGWANLYRVKDVFQLRLYPNRGLNLKEATRKA